jgi:hypothetical protein
MRLVLSVALATLVAGCAHQETLVPAAPPSTAWLLPEGGDVLVQVIGTSEVGTRDTWRSGYRAMKLRMTVTNASAQTWVIDPRKQIARMGGFSTSFPSNVSAAPLVVGPGDTRTLDLFYPIPTPNYGPELPRHVALDWQIATPQGIIAHRARAEFDRHREFGWVARTRM